MAIRFNQYLGRNVGLAGITFAVTLSVSPAAMADCNGTGFFAPAGGSSLSQFLPFAAGGAINSLVSAINTANTAFLTQSSAFVSAPANPQPNQEGGGVWSRAIGGEVKVSSTSTTTNVNSTLLGALPGSVTCNSQTKLTFAGAQLGTDVAQLNWNGWNVHVGTTLGYLGARARDVSSAGPLNPSGGTFADTLQVPFVGGYAVATKGSFFIDGQLRADYYQNSLNDPLTSALFNQKLDARGWAFTGNIGYNFQLQNNWFIEPSAGIVVSDVKVDPLNIAGTFAALGVIGGTNPGQLNVSDIDSTLGRLSVRAGTSVSSGNIIWQPFGVASVYHEFQGDVQSSFNGNGLPALLRPLAFTGNVSSTNIGTYGQFSLGIAAQLANTGLLGYVRADYRTGDNIQGYNVNGGIRYQFTPELVSAPMYTKAVKAPVAVVTAYNWTGFFIGGSAGILAGHTNWNFVGFPSATNPRFAGALGGMQIGYDYQAGKWVFGVEANANATNAHGARPCLAPLDVFLTCEDSVNWMGTATGRVGYALWNRTLLYARAGAAFGDARVVVNCNTGQASIFAPINSCGTNDSRSRVGWTAGIGSEFALTKNWTVRAETNYFDLGTARFTVAGPTPIDVHESGYISTIGVNYRFAPGPVIAKY